MHTTEKMTEALNNCKTLASTLRVVANTPNVTMRDLDKATQDLNESLGVYNNMVRENAYEFACTTPDPVLYAAQSFFFTGLAHKNVKRESGSDRIADITIDTDETEPYRLKTLESTYADLGLGDLMKNQKWSSRVLRARMYAAAAECKLLKCDMQKFRDAFTMTNDMVVYDDNGTLVDVCDMSESEKNAWTEELTITQIMKRLQVCVDNILFDTTGRDDGQNRYRVRREDARFFMQFMFWLDDKTGKPHIRTVPKTYALMFIVLCHVVTGMSYDFMWKEESNK